MKEIMHIFLLVKAKFISEMHLRQPGFACSTSGLFAKNTEIIEKFKGASNSRYIYQIWP